VLTTITATADPALDRHALAGPLHLRSLAGRDEYGPITGRPGGLFTAPAAALTLEPCDELGRRVAMWVPDGDLL
jgi:hypothetical protein